VSITVEVGSTRFSDIEQACLEAARAAAREAMVGGSAGGWKAPEVLERGRLATAGAGPS